MDRQKEQQMNRNKLLNPACTLGYTVQCTLSKFIQEAIEEAIIFGVVIDYVAADAPYSTSI